MYTDDHGLFSHVFEQPNANSSLPQQAWEKTEHTATTVESLAYQRAPFQIKVYLASQLFCTLLYIKEMLTNV